MDEREFLQQILKMHASLVFLWRSHYQELGLQQVLDYAESRFSTYVCEYLEKFCRCFSSELMQYIAQSPKSRICPV